MLSMVELTTGSLQLMNVGLLYTPVSIYQMTRGALVLFVALFSVMFLRRRLWLYQYDIFFHISSLWKFWSNFSLQMGLTHYCHVGRGSSWLQRIFDQRRR